MADLTQDTFQSQNGWRLNVPILELWKSESFRDVEVGSAEIYMRRTLVAHTVGTREAQPQSLALSQLGAASVSSSEMGMMTMHVP